MRWLGRRNKPEPLTSDASGLEMPLTFDASTWQQAETSAWTNSDGDAVILNFFNLPPDLPAALEDLKQLRKATSANCAAHGGGLVELDVITLDGIPAVQQIVKLPDPEQQTGVVYIGSFTVPRANCSVVLRVQCFEVRGQGFEQLPTGFREAIVLDGFLGEHSDEDSTDDIMAEWAQHPYASRIRGGLPRNRADDRKWDEQFPDHPLSRARRALDAIRPSVRLDRDFKEQPAFRDPAMQPRKPRKTRRNQDQELASTVRYSFVTCPSHQHSRLRGNSKALEMSPTCTYRGRVRA